MPEVQVGAETDGESRTLLKTAMAYLRSAHSLVLRPSSNLTSFLRLSAVNRPVRMSWIGQDADMLDTVLSLIGAIATVVAVGLAYLTLRTARATIGEAKAARLDAERAARDAATDRRESELDLRHHRIERVGEILEAVASAAQQQGGGRWQTHRNRLAQALVGLHAQLPKCVALVNEVKAPEQLARYLGEARAEVEFQLGNVAERTTLGPS